MNPIQSTDSAAYVNAIVFLDKAIDSLDFTHVKMLFRQAIQRYSNMVHPMNRPTMFRIENTITEIKTLQTQLSGQKTILQMTVNSAKKLARECFDPLCQQQDSTTDLANHALIKVLGRIDDKEANMKEALSEFERQLMSIVIEQINELAKTIYWFTSIANGDVRFEVIERLKSRANLLFKCISEKAKLEDLNEQTKKLEVLKTQVLERRNQKQQELNKFLSKCQNAITILQINNPSEIEKLNQQFISEEKIEIHQAYCRLHKKEFQPTLTRFLFSSQFNVEQLIQSLKRIMRLKKQADTCVIQKGILDSTDTLSETLTKDLVQHILSFVHLPKTAKVCKSWNEMTDKTFFQNTLSFISKNITKESWKEIIGRLLTDHPEIQTNRQLLIVLNNWACDWIGFLHDAQFQMIPAKYRNNELMDRREFIQVKKIISAFQWYQELSSMHHMDLNVYHFDWNTNTRSNMIQSIVPQVKIFRNLTKINLGCPECKVIGDEFSEFKDLKSMTLHVQTVSEKVFDLTKLDTLIICESNVNLSNLKNLTNLTTLYLKKCGLKEFPMDVLHLTNLETLELTFNQITKISQEIATLPNLEWLDLEENPFTEIPDFFDSPELDHLDFYFASESIKKIPSGFFFSTNCRKIHFAINIFMSLAKFKFLNQALEAKEIFNHLPIEIQNQFPSDCTYEFPLLCAFAYFHHFIKFDDQDVLLFDRSLELLPEKVINEYKSFKNEDDESDVDTIENFVNASEERKKAFDSFTQMIKEIS